MARRLQHLSFLYAVNGLLTLAALAKTLPHGQPFSTLIYTTAYVGTALLLLFLALYLPLYALLPNRGPRIIAILESARLALLILDVCAWNATGLHLYNAVIVQQLFEGRFFHDIGLSSLMLFEVLLLVLVAASTQLVLPRLYRQLQARSGGISRRGLTLIAAICAALFVLHIFAPSMQREQLSRYLPLYEWLQPTHVLHARLLIRSHLKEHKKALYYPLQELPEGARFGDSEKLARPNILFMAAESLRGDMLNPVDMPEVWGYGASHYALSSQHHYSGGHQTWEGIFSLLYGLNGYHRQMFADRGKPPYPLRLLKQMGYRTVALCASSLNFPRHKIHTSFDQVSDLSDEDGDHADRQITQRAIRMLADQRALPAESRRPLFIFLFYASTHYPYFFPSDEAPFQPYRPWPESNLLHPLAQDRQRLWNRYRNAARHLSKQAGLLLNAAEPLWQENQLAVLFTGDHGEEFWDEGQFGHGSLRLNNARFQTPLMLALPGRRLSSVTVSSHVDLFPTLFDFLQVPLAISAYSDGKSLLGPRTPPLVHLNICNFPYEEGFALIAPPYKIFAQRDEEFGFEINQVLDLDDRPIEWNRADVESQLQTAMNRMDRFYPGHSLARTRTISFRPLPHYPFEPRRGPIRTPQTPDVLPWQE